LGYVRSDWASFEVRRADSSAVHVSGADTEVGTGVEVRVATVAACAVCGLMDIFIVDEEVSYFKTKEIEGGE
jgi:hypothetical protein